jgi:hypothetical protein
LEAIRETKAFRAMKQIAIFWPVLQSGILIDSIQLARFNFEELSNANEPFGARLKFC